MQVIGTEAQGDVDILREISEKARVAQTSSGVTSFSLAQPVTSGVQDTEASLLPSRSGFMPDFVPGTDATTQPEEKLPSEAGTEDTAGPEDVENEVVHTYPCAPAAGPYCVYVVQDGDTLSAIAETLGLQGTSVFSAAELIALSNDLNDAQNWLITPGQELWIPVDSGVIHTVGPDESVSVLASLYGVTSADIVAANGLGDADTVVVGSTLLVPSPNLWPVSGPAAAVAEEDAPTGEATPEDEASTEDETATETPEAEATEEASEGDAPAAEDTAEPTEEPQEEAEPADAVATEEPKPDQAAAAPARNANPSVAEVKDLFAAGYVAAGGPPQYLEHLLGRVIACESGYNLRAFNPAGPFYGLMQFLPATWANTGGGDWFDPWQQGHNTGVLLQSSSPQSQWPFCWR